jgi:hypothetical protein
MPEMRPIPHRGVSARIHAKTLIASAVCAFVQPRRGGSQKKTLFGAADRKLDRFVLDVA